MKFIAFTVAFTFLVTNLGVSPNAFATPTGRPEVALPYQVKLDENLRIAIPQELGKLEHFKMGQGPAIFHIQTAHGHYQAQQQIRSLLHYLDKNYGVKTVLVEGSAFKLEPQILNFFPKDKKLTMKVNDVLTKHALVKGAELYLLEAKGANAFGIEKVEAYRANRDSFIKVLVEKKETKQFLADMNMQIERLASHFLNKDLREFLRRVESFEKNQIPFDAWLASLKGEAQKRLEIDLASPAQQLDWPMLVRVFKMQELSSKLDKKAFVTERKEFLKAIRRFMPSTEYGVRSTAPQQAVDTPYAFHRTPYQAIEQLLESDQVSQQLPDPETSLLFEDMVKQLPENFNYGKFPNVRYFIGTLLLQSELKAERLMLEVQKLSDTLAAKLTQTKEEKKLVALLADHRLLQKLFALELTPADYDNILLRKEGLKPSELVKQLSGTEYGVRSTAKESRGTPYAFRRTKLVEFTHVKELDELYEKAMAFYSGVKERDSKMEARIEERLKETGATKVAVITGGFHSQPMQEHFINKGYSYALISPKLSGVDEAGHSAYIQNMLNGTAEGVRRTAQEPRDTPYSVRRTEPATLEDVFLSDTYTFSTSSAQFYGNDPASLAAGLSSVVTSVVDVSHAREARDHFRKTVRSTERRAEAFDAAPQKSRVEARSRVRTESASTVRAEVREWTPEMKQALRELATMIKRYTDSVKDSPYIKSLKEKETNGVDYEKESAVLDALLVKIGTDDAPAADFEALVTFLNGSILKGNSVPANWVKAKQLIPDLAVLEGYEKQVAELIRAQSPARSEARGIAEVMVKNPPAQNVRLSFQQGVELLGRLVGSKEVSLDMLTGYPTAPRVFVTARIRNKKLEFFTTTGPGGFQPYVIRSNTIYMVEPDGALMLVPEASEKTIAL